MLAARERLTVALDLPSAAKAWFLVETLGERVLHYKVGHELFTSAGPDIVRRLVEEGRRVFLDLKLHEIPYSVAQAVAAAGALLANPRAVVVLGTRMLGVAGRSHSSREAYGSLAKPSRS